MKEIVIISGKGGTGKTSLSASFSVLGGRNVISADCDVDASDMHLLLKPDHALKKDFYNGEKAVVDENICNNCGACEEICRFDAIGMSGISYRVNELNCEGCAYCSRVCPVDAITMQEQCVGEFYVSNIKTGSRMVHARLGIGAENSGKLVAKVKNEARIIAVKEGIGIVLVDGSPGIGCPVLSSLTGADLVVLVTEPTISGFHDLKRVRELVKKFRIKSCCIINKSDINPGIKDNIRDYLDREAVTHLADIPYDEDFTRAMTLGKTIVEYEDSSMKPLIEDIWEKINNLLTEEDRK